ncbi:MAG: hypothetical protein M1820_010469 [Bogoriella megaspora]|nr:MAG: hypothetical protein M1820_010469 [Bogoriella megaspora]
MARTVVDTAHIPKGLELAKPYGALDDASVAAIAKPSINGTTIMGAAGGIVSNVHDLLIFYRALLKAGRSQLRTTKGGQRGGRGTDIPALMEVRTMLSAHHIMKTSALGEKSYGLGRARCQLPNEVSDIGSNLSLTEMPLLGASAPPTLAWWH